MYDRNEPIPAATELKQRRPHLTRHAGTAGEHLGFAATELKQRRPHLTRHAGTAGEHLGFGMAR
jgi:hypothetical protein